MIIEDKVFGKVSYDGIWTKNDKIKFIDKEYNIILIIAGDDDTEFEEEQYIAYQALMENWDTIQYDVLELILIYYKELREELGYDIELNVDYPEIITTKEMLDHITLVGINVAYGEIYGGRSIGLSFDCTWNSENGLGVRLNDETVIKIGYQDEAI